MALDFAGTYEHSLDSKGRVIIPVCFREQLGSHFTIALNSDFSAIALYPQEQWEQTKERLGRIRTTDPKGVRYVRYILSNTFPDNEMDAQGRVLIPMKLRNNAKVGLSRELVFAGVAGCVEIWDAARFKAQEGETEENFEDLLLHVDEHYA